MTAGPHRGDDPGHGVEIADTVLDADDTGDIQECQGGRGIEDCCAALIHDHRQRGGRGDVADVLDQSGRGGGHQVGREQQEAVGTTLLCDGGILLGCSRPASGAGEDQRSAADHLHGRAYDVAILRVRQRTELTGAASDEPCRWVQGVAGPYRASGLELCLEVARQDVTVNAVIGVEGGEREGQEAGDHSCPCM